MQVKYEPWTVKDEEVDLWGVVITDGDFNGTIIAINELDFDDTRDGMKLDYTIYKLPEVFDKEKLSDDPRFKDMLQFLVQDILEKAIHEYENRKNYSPELNP